MLKPGTKIIKRKGLNYVSDDSGRILRFKPWLGDTFSFLYDRIMKNSIFPKKFGGEINRHYEILSRELKDIHNKPVLELATGSGSAVNFLPHDNLYTGTDISPGLLKKAVENFNHAGFKNAEFFVVNVDDLPFEDHCFEVVLCILSLNFFADINKVFQEIRRVSNAGAIFICSVPVPERNRVQSTIRGTLYTEEKLKLTCHRNNLIFEEIPSQNGALIYFKAIIG